MSDPNPKEARRREILLAALEAFAQRGYDKTSMDDIVETSGLSKGTLYWYFDSKAALFAAMVDMVFEDFSVMFEQVVQDSYGLPPPPRWASSLASAGRRRTISSGRRRLMACWPRMNVVATMRPGRRMDTCRALSRVDWRQFQ